MPRRAHLFGLASILAASVLLGGCGVRGPLEPPPGAQAAAHPAPAAGAAPAHSDAAYVPLRSAAELNDSVTPRAEWEKPKTTQKPDPLQGANRPNKPFFLDFLL